MIQVAPAPVEMIKKPIGGEKNGGFRMVPKTKGPKWYPAEDVKKPVPGRRTNKPTKLRETIKPGSVLIILAGNYRGSRVIFLKQLASGLLLVTGPFSVNRIPLKRVEQAFVIATSTIVDISGVDVSKFDDDYFKREKKDKKKAMDVDTTAEEEDAAEKERSKPTAERIADQKAVDDILVPRIEKIPLLSSYMKTKFTLKKGQYPHAMKF